MLTFVQDRLRARRVARETTQWYRGMYGSANANGWQRTRERVRAMGAEARESNVALLIALWPLFVELEGDYPFVELHEKIARLCERAGVLLPLYRGQASSEFWVHPADWHPNESAHRLAGERLAPLARAIVETRATAPDESGRARQPEAVGRKITSRHQR